MASGYRVGAAPDAAELDEVGATDAGATWTPVLADDTRNGQLADLARNGGMTAALVIVVVGSLLFVHGFSSSYNIETVLQQSAFLGFVAVGMTFIVGTGNFIDLSVVAQIATAGIVITVLEGQGFLVAAPAAVGSCLAFAAVNWLGVGLMRANSVVMTLGVETAGIGLLDYLTNGANYSSTSKGLDTVMTKSAGSIPYVFLMLLAFVVVAELVLSRTRLGYGVRAVGANRNAAALSGVRTSGLVGVAFVAVSLSCVMAGVALAGFNSGALNTMGTGYDFNSLAAVIVGGNSLQGGEASALRTLVGVLFLEVLLNVLVLVGLPYDWQNLVEGSIVVVAVASDAWFRRGSSWLRA